jgi:hypothetical protein
MPKASETNRRPTLDDAVSESAVYWFTLMEMAKERGDFERAAEAKRQLKRLGVTVTYRAPRPRTPGGPCCVA